MPELNFFTNTYLYAICWGLTNSLWYAFGGYIVLKAAGYLLGEFKPEIRYYFSYSLLFLVFFLSLLSVYSNITNPVSISSIESGYIYIKTSENISLPGFLKNIRLDIIPNLFQNLKYLIHSNVGIIITFWFIGILFLLIQYMFALREIRTIRNSSISNKNPLLLNILTKIKNHTGDNYNIRLIESKLVSVPSVIGIIKPIIIFPAGMVGNLSPEQVEMILAHEYAHIKRLDPLFKQFQSLIEILFFYNPFVWLISQEINSEREKCCDDFAISTFNNPTALSKAIKNLAEFNLSNSFALHITGRKGLSYVRIQRILKPETMVTNIPNIGIGLIFSFVITLILTGFLLSNDINKKSQMTSQNDLLLATQFQQLTGADELLQILEKKFGDVGKYQKVENDSDLEINFENDDQVDEEQEQALTFNGLESKLNKLLGNSSTFNNIFNTDRIIDLSSEPLLEQAGSNESISLIDNIDISSSFNFDFKLNRNWNSQKIEKLKKALAELEISLNRLGKNFPEE